MANRSDSTRTMEERFWSKVEMIPFHTCWEWVGAKRHHGYGYLTKAGGIRNGYVRAHRFAYELLVGPIAIGSELDHLCRNKGCVNPSHLEAVSHQVNMSRSGVIQATGRCKRGHDPSELGSRKDRPRHYYCRACNRERYAVRRAPAY